MNTRRNKLLLLIVVLVFVLPVWGSALADFAPIMIDGTLSTGEWDRYYLGKDLTVDVYGFADSTYVYLAYEADTTAAKWIEACEENVDAEFYFVSPVTIAFPNEGWTLFQPGVPQVVQTDGTDWDFANAVDPATIPGFEYAYIPMASVSTADCKSGAAHNNIAELKIPISLLTSQGDDGRMPIFGVYWKSGPGEVFFVDLPSVVTADLIVTKTEATDPVVPGQQVVYTVTVQNAGPDSAHNVTATDTLPAGVTFVSTSGCAEDPNGVPTCTLGTIANGATKEYTITVTAPLSASTITNTVSVTADEVDPNLADNTDTETTTVQTAEDSTQDIVDEVNVLAEIGSLKEGQANGLIQPLLNAIKSLEKGKTAPACAHLQDFIDKISQKVANGDLSQAEGDALIAQAQALQVSIGCTP